MELKIALAMPQKKYGDASFGQRLAAIRKARGLTQVQLAKALGTTQRAISYYENESGFPSPPVLIALARVLRVTTDELLGIKPAKIDQGNPQKRRLWKRFQRMVSLPERDQRAVLRLINSLSSSHGSAVRVEATR